jgi:hypothetical protein
LYDLFTISPFNNAMAFSGASECALHAFDGNPRIPEWPR